MLYPQQDNNEYVRYIKGYYYSSFDNQWLYRITSNAYINIDAFTVGEQFTIQLVKTCFFCFLHLLCALCKCIITPSAANSIHNWFHIFDLSNCIGVFSLEMGYVYLFMVYETLLYGNETKEDLHQRQNLALLHAQVIVCLIFVSFVVAVDFFLLVLANRMCRTLNQRIKSK